MGCIREKQALVSLEVILSVSSNNHDGVAGEGTGLQPALSCDQSLHGH